MSTLNLSTYLVILEYQVMTQLTSLANDVAHQLLRGEISAPNTISRPAAFEVARDRSFKSWYHSWDYDHTARYTYNVIPSVQTKLLFPLERDIGFSYERLLLHDTILEDDSYRTGTSTSSACECRSISCSIVQDISISERTLLIWHLTY